MGKFLTYSGVLVDFANFNANMVNLSDIAHHLTNEQRYAGAFPFNIHYSVAEHSLILAVYMEEEGWSDNIIAAALLHDASEAYLKDLPSGLKPLLPDYVELEKKIQYIIEKKYNITVSPKARKAIKEYDKRIVLDEIKMLNDPNRSNVYKKINKSSPLELYHVHINNREGRFYEIGHAPKQLIYDSFMDMCYRLNVSDTKKELFMKPLC